MTHPRGKSAKSAAKPVLSAEELARQAYRRKRRFVRTGQVIMILGALMAVVHWLTHIEVFGPEQPSLALDLLFGYPMAVVLLIIGGITAGKK